LWFALKFFAPQTYCCAGLTNTTAVKGRIDWLTLGTSTGQGYRLATSTGGVLTGRGADIITIDDPLKPEEALSKTLRQACNEWFVHTLYSRLNDKRTGAILLIMQRLHEDDLVGHVLGLEPWEVLSFPAIAEKDEEHRIETIWGPRRFRRRI
jgi:hypothetical protein